MQVPEITEVVDIPQLQETFADRIGVTTLDENAVRIELRVARIQAVDEQGKMRGNLIPVSRLVLTHQSAFELYQALHGMMVVLEKKGVLKKAMPASPVKQ
jgi:hypothetical protein